MRKIDAATGIITTVAGTGIPGYSGNGSPATAAQVIPTDIYFNSGGDMFIADAGNNCIRKVQSGLGTQNLIKQDVINLYPNPTTGKFVVENKTTSNQSGVEIFDCVGKKVYESIFDNTQTEIDISAQPAGVYMVEVTDTTSGFRTIKKVVKE